MNTNTHSKKDQQPLKKNQQEQAVPQTQGAEPPVQADSPIRLHEVDVERVVVLGYD